MIMTLNDFDPSNDQQKATSTISPSRVERAQSQINLYCQSALGFPGDGAKQPWDKISLAAVINRAWEIPLQAINGRCLACGYRLAWILVQGRKGIPHIRESRSYGKESFR
jgi:hypothetical protein